MTIRALTIPESVPHGSGAASQALFSMTGSTLELAVSAFERIGRQLRVVESPYLERFRHVTRFTLSLGRRETKLPSVNVTVATGALAWRPAVRSPSATEPIFFRRAMATVTGGFRMSTGQRPQAVIDPG